MWVNRCESTLAVVTYFKVSLLLQVEQAKQFTHQALLRAETTSKKQKKTEKYDLEMQIIHIKGARTHR